MKGTIHWVSAPHAARVEVRLYNHLFRDESPAGLGEEGGLADQLNPHALETLEECFVEPSLVSAPAGSRYQFERLGYFCVDPDSTDARRVFNRTVPLRDSWAKIERKGASQAGSGGSPRRVSPDQ